MKLSTEDKQVKEFNKDYFDYGVHKVKMVVATLDETAAGKEFIEVTVCDPENGEITDSARLWFVGGATNISVNAIRQIIVHNTKDADKDKAREAVDKAPDTEALVTLLNDHCTGGELWFTKYQDAERTYTGQDGKVRKSINKNVMGYEPKPRPELMPVREKAPEFTDEELNSEPFGDKPNDPASTVPKSW